MGRAGEYLKDGEDLLSDYTDLSSEAAGNTELQVREEIVPYPFQYQ